MDALRFIQSDVVILDVMRFEAVSIYYLIIDLTDSVLPSIGKW